LSQRPQDATILTGNEEKRIFRMASGPPGLHLNPETGLHEAHDSRRTLYASSLGLIENFAISSRSTVPQGYTSACRVVLTYLGAAHWQIGRSETVIDPNRTLLLQAGQEFSDRQAGINIGRASVVMTPDPEVLEEICGSLGIKRDTVFNKISAPATMQLRLLTHKLIGLAGQARDMLLMNDELMIAALSESLAPAAKIKGPPPPLIIERVKALLHSLDADRLKLSDIAAQIGATPAYLTRAFQQAEGVPLYRYHRRLRLARALVELRYCEDITTLAFTLGFSSHSHFSAAFRAAFGLTPSEFRSLC